METEVPLIPGRHDLTADSDFRAGVPSVWRPLRSEKAVEEMDSWPALLSRVSLECYMMTSPALRTAVNKPLYLSSKNILTGIIPSNGRLHDSLHPLSDDTFLVRAEEVRPLGVMDNLKSITPGLSIFVRDHFVSGNVDVTLDFCFLFQGSTF